MPDQNHKPKILILFVILLTIAAAGYVVLRQMPGKFQEFEYEKVFNTPTNEARIGKIAKRLNMEGFKPHIFSVGQWHGKTIIAAASETGIQIIDTNGTKLTSITTDTEPTAIKIIGPENGSRIICSTDNSIQIIDLQTKTELTSISIPNEKALITSITTTDNYIYAADAQAKCLWQMNIPLHEDLKGFDADRVTICPLGVKQFILPGSHFELATDINGSDIWAANTGNHRIDKFSPDIAEPTDSWGHPSFRPDGFAGCCNPASFTILADGSFVTAEKGSIQVKLFSDSGRYMGLIADRRDFLRPEAFKTLIFPMVDSIPTEPKTVYVLDTTTETILVITIE